MKAILITGCSSGFGLETARYFLEREWKVVATMRTPREDVLPRSYARDVAAAVWRAVNDPSTPVRIPAGADAVLWAEAS